MTRGFQLEISAAFIPFFSTVLILFAAGCGSRTGSVNFAHADPPVAQWPQSIALGDLNGDGKLDMVVPTYSGSDTATILMGNGDGTFNNGPVFPVNGQQANNAVLADFNGDGKLDVAISLPDAFNSGGTQGQVQMLLGNGDGSFSPLQPISFDGVYVVAGGDFNGDGKPDLLVLYPAYSGTVFVLLGNGDGTFTTSTPISLPAPNSVAIADFNRDGKLDLAVTNGYDDTVTVLLGKGDGTFTQVGSTPATGFEPVSIAAGDFNGDGIADLGISNQNNGAPISGTVTILLGRGDGTFTPEPTLTTGIIPDSIATADFNGDGKTDLVTANAGSDTVSVFLSNGDGTFAAPLDLAAGAVPNFVAIGDLNGDGVPDLSIANNTTSSVTVWMGQR